MPAASARAHGRALSVAAVKESHMNREPKIQVPGTETGESRFFAYKSLTGMNFGGPIRLDFRTIEG